MRSARKGRLVANTLEDARPSRSQPPAIDTLVLVLLATRRLCEGVDS